MIYGQFAWLCREIFFIKSRGREVIEVKVWKSQQVSNLLKLRSVTRVTLQFSTSVEPRQWDRSRLVRRSVKKSYHTSRSQNFPKLGQKLQGDESGTVTRPDFPGKIYLINYSWKQVLAIFSSLGPQIDFKLHIMIVQNVSQHLAMISGHA